MSYLLDSTIWFTDYDQALQTTNAVYLRLIHGAFQLRPLRVASNTHEDVHHILSPGVSCDLLMCH